jgi:hypothetical protein
VREDWEVHPPCKSSSCTSSLKSPLVEDGSEQSIYHRLNCHATLNSGEELLPIPISNGPRGTSLLLGRIGAEEHREAEDAWGLGRSYGYARQQEGTRSSCLFLGLASGSTDTSPAWSRCISHNLPGGLGKLHRQPDRDGDQTTHPLPSISRAKRLGDRAWERPGPPSAPTCHPYRSQAFF